MKKLIATIIVVLSLLALMTGCTGTSISADTPVIESISAEISSADTGETTDTDMPGMTPFAPAEGTGVNVTVDVSVSNFEMSDTADAMGEGDGHLMYYMDDLPTGISMSPGTGEPGLTEEPGTNGTMGGFSSTDTSYTFENVSQGIHIFSVQLVDNSSQPLSPQVIAAVILSVPAETGEADEGLGPDTTMPTETETTTPTGIEPTTPIVPGTETPGETTPIVPGTETPGATETEPMTP